MTTLGEAAGRVGSVGFIVCFQCVISLFVVLVPRPSSSSSIFRPIRSRTRDEGRGRGRIEQGRTRSAISAFNILRGFRVSWGDKQLSRWAMFHQFAQEHENAFLAD